MRTIDETKQGRLGSVPTRDLGIAGNGLKVREVATNVFTKCSLEVLRSIMQGHHLSDEDKILLHDIDNLIGQVEEVYIEDLDNLIRRKRKRNRNGKGE
jgi:hypothetical protein